MLGGIGMSKLQEFRDQLVQIEREIDEKLELKMDLLNRIIEINKVKPTQTFALNVERLHKLLCILEHSIITKEAVEDNIARKELIESQHELSWVIADLFGYDLNEGTIDPKTLKFYTFKSRW
jgi:Zn-dependent M32 family carboxypeptidase